MHLFQAEKVFPSVGPSIIAALVLWLIFDAAQAGEYRLVLREAGETVLELPLDQLPEVVRPVEIELFNPLINKQKKYMAVSLRDMLDRAYKDSWSSSYYSDIAFKALDGYEAVGSLELLTEGGAFLAYEDLDWTNGWEPVGRKQADPGPLFLVWTEKHQTTINAYPWPWQVAEVNLLRFEDQYPAVMPTGAGAGTPAQLGFELFRSRCLRCHAMNQQGGKIGPDLSDQDLDNLYSYFQHQDQHRTQHTNSQ